MKKTVPCDYYADTIVKTNPQRVSHPELRQLKPFACVVGVKLPTCPLS